VTAVGVVMAREFMQRVRTRSFMIATIAAPVIMVGIIVVPAWIGARDAMSERVIVLVDRTGVLAEGVIPRLEAVGYSVEVVEPGSTEYEGLRERLEAGDLQGAVYVGQETLERGTARWVGKDAPSVLRRLGIQEGVSRTALEVRLRGSGEDEAVLALMGGGVLEVETFGEDDRVARITGMGAGFVGALFLYMVLMIYGSMVLRAVLEEKTGRIVEIIISSVRPWELMLGKVLGVGAVGLFQLVIWAAAGSLILTLGVPYLLAFLSMDAEFLTRVSDVTPGAGVLAFFVVCFLLGYFLYASLFAAVGAMCSSEEEAQQLQFPVVMLVVFPIVLLMPTLENPDASWAQAASLFPFFAPILMFGRVAVGAAASWEVALSVVLMLGALWVTAWIAGRIYRVGILMQGKRPTVPELWRWVRQG
jgi:ABC-2 type transport system permease protein